MWLRGKGGVPVIRVDDHDVAGLAALHPAVRAHLHLAGDDDEDFQGRVPVVVVGADPVDVLASLEAARFAGARSRALRSRGGSRWRPWKPS